MGTSDNQTDINVVNGGREDAGHAEISLPQEQDEISVSDSDEVRESSSADVCLPADTSETDSGGAGDQSDMTNRKDVQESGENSAQGESADDEAGIFSDEDTILEEQALRRKERRSRVWFITKYVLVNISRFILAITFLFSAFTKANDPVGLVIKLKDYVGAIGVVNMPEFLLYLAGILLTLVETVLGIYLFVGMRKRRRVAAMATVFMLIMTAVTVWIVVKNPVSDCGCFGDALILTNNQTLAKNIVLLAMAFFITANHKMMFRLVHKDWNWLVTIPVVLAVTALFSYCAYMLPLVDYLPFAEGTDLRTTVKTGDALDMNYKVTFVYTNGTDTLELTDQDDDPDSTVWKYVETRNELLNDHLDATTEFFVVDQDGDDVTIDILENNGFVFIVTVPDLGKATPETGGVFNNLYAYCSQFGYEFYFITNAADGKTKHKWVRDTGAEYPLYESDDRVLWQVVRDNPGLMLLNDGKVLKKWSRLGIPNFDYSKPLQPDFIQELVNTKRYAAKPIRF